MKKPSKSWIITIISFILVIAGPLLNDVLAPYGIIITEKELEHFLYAFLGTGALGGGISLYKKKLQRKQDSADTSPNDIYYNDEEKAFKIKNKKNYWRTIPDKILGSDKSSKNSIPPLGPDGADYKTNFENGNTLQFGTKYLYVRMVGAKSYVTGALMNSTKELLLTDQSDKNDEYGIELIKFMLMDTTGQPLPRGTYYLTIRADRQINSGYTEIQWEIV